MNIETPIIRRTPLDINRHNLDDLQARAVYFKQLGPDAIQHRIKELDEEWDIQRVIEAHAAALGFAGLVLGTFKDRRLFLLTGVACALLLRHAIQGLYPIIPPLRRLGFRTHVEIDEERRLLEEAL